MSEGKTKVTRELLCEESRFILANVMAEARYGRQNRYDDIRRVCEGALTIPFAEYIGFLDAAGYLRHDRGSEALEVTKDGESVVNGGNLSELTERAVLHFKQARRRSSADVRERPAERVVERVVERAPERPSERVVERVVERAPERPSERTVERAPERVERPSERLVERGPERLAGAAARSRVSGVIGGEINPAGAAVDRRYEKLETIGSGGLGTVYRARQVQLDREVALKEIRELFGFFGDEQRPEIVRRFADVVRSAANLAHPNIVPIHEVELEREYPYVVTELAPNGSCRRLINDAESIPIELVIKYLLQTLHALQAAHEQRMFHRGLKPENLLIDAYGNVKVSDFGFARIVERDAMMRQVYVGTGNIAYMAPELYHDPAAGGAQGDIYALGIIFYELLTRRLPGRRSPMPSHVNRELPAGIDDIFDGMTHDSRAERYSSVADILDDISRLDGLTQVLDRQTQVLVAENPLNAIKFREADDAEPATASAEPADPADIDERPRSSASPSYRPYSYQQRRKR